MAKLTAKTTKVGQMCTLIKESVLTYRYKHFRRKLQQDEIGHEYHDHSCYVADLNTSLSFVIDINEYKANHHFFIPVKTLPKDTVVQVIEYNPKIVFDMSKGFEYSDIFADVKIKVIGGEHDGLIFVAELSKIRGRLETGNFEDLAKDINEAPKYKIFYKDKLFKDKIFSDLTKIKASLMDAIGYNNKVYNLNQHYQDLSPEVCNSVPDWLGGSGKLSRKDMKDVKIYEWVNKKKGKEADFDALEYYDSLMDFMKVTAQFGSAVRQIYKENKGSNEFTTIVCFRHEDYKLPHAYYEDLKESDTIKDAIKNSKIKGYKKCTKYGKTAITLKNENDALKLLKLLKPEDYFVLDMKGNELNIQNERFIQNIIRLKKFEKIVNTEFQEDFDLNN